MNKLMKEIKKNRMENVIIVIRNCLIKRLGKLWC